MKKTYIQPTTEVVKIGTAQLLYTSEIRLGDPTNADTEDEEWVNTPDSDGRLWGE